MKLVFKIIYIYVHAYCNMESWNICYFIQEFSFNLHMNSRLHEPHPWIQKWSLLKSSVNNLVHAP